MKFFIKYNSHDAKAWKYEHESILELLAYCRVHGATLFEVVIK